MRRHTPHCLSNRLIPSISLLRNDVTQIAEYRIICRIDSQTTRITRDLNEVGYLQWHSISIPLMEVQFRDSALSFSVGQFHSIPISSCYRAILYDDDRHDEKSLQPFASLPAVRKYFQFPLRVQ
jgi:hypothetical protein